MAGYVNDQHVHRLFEFETAWELLFEAVVVAAWIFAMVSIANGL